MNRISSYFTIFSITFIACTYLQGSDPEFRPPAPPPSPVDTDQIHPHERVGHEAPSPRSDTNSMPDQTSEGSSLTTSDHQGRIEELRRQSLIVNKPTPKKSIARTPTPVPWTFSLRAHHLEYFGGAVIVLSMVTLYTGSSNDSQTKRSGIPTDAVAVGYQVLNVLKSLGLKGIVGFGGLYGFFKVKRWIHAKCRSDLQKAKDEFETLLNEHIADDNARLTEATKKDENMCNALDGIVAAVTLMNQREDRIVKLLMKISRTLPPEQQTVLVQMLTPDEQVLFNNQPNSLTAARLAEAQPAPLTHPGPQPIATKVVNHPIAALPTLMPHRPASPTNNPITAETAKIEQILHGVQHITQGVHKDNQEALQNPLRSKIPKGNGLCGCCQQQ